jgi:hypothetical protein
MQTVGQLVEPEIIFDTASSTYLRSARRKGKWNKNDVTVYYYCKLCMNSVHPLGDIVPG